MDKEKIANNRDVFCQMMSDNRVDEKDKSCHMEKTVYIITAIAGIAGLLMGKMFGADLLMAAGKIFAKI